MTEESSIARKLDELIALEQEKIRLQKVRIQQAKEYEYQRRIDRQRDEDKEQRDFWAIHSCL